MTTQVLMMMTSLRDLKIDAVMLAVDAQSLSTSQRKLYASVSWPLSRSPAISLRISIMRLESCVSKEVLKLSLLVL